MKKTTVIASFLFLATLAGGAQAAPMVATKAYVDDGLGKKQNTLTPGTNIQLHSQLNGTVEISANLDSVTMHAGTDITIGDDNTINANYGSLLFPLADSDVAAIANLESGAARISAIKQTNGLLDVRTSGWGRVLAGEAAPASGGDVYNAIQRAVAGLQPTITGIGDIVVNNNQVSVTYDTLDYDSTSDTEVTGLADGSKRIKTVLQTNGKVGVTVTDWGQVAAGEAAPASGGDVYAAIQNTIQNLYTAGNGISITNGVIAAKGNTNRNIEVSPDGIGISMDEYDTGVDNDPGFTHENEYSLYRGGFRIARIEQNDKGEITVTTDKWNEMWTANEPPIRTIQIRKELNKKTNDIIAGRLIRVTEENTTEDELINNTLGEKNYTINSTLYPGRGITFVDNCLVSGISGEISSGTCIALRTSTASALRFNEDGELSLSGLSYSSIDDENAAGVENGTSRIASITQNEGVISVTTGSWVESLERGNLTDENMGVPATAKAIVAAIDQSVDPVEQTANNAAANATEALRVANEAAADAAEALRVANNAIPKPNPNECSQEGKRCVLTYGLNSEGVLTYEWEVITRATGE